MTAESSQDSPPSLETGSHCSYGSGPSVLEKGEELYHVELEKDVKETVAITSELQRRSPEALAPPPRKPLSDSVMALISRYSPSQGFADGDEPESEPCPPWPS